MDGLTERERALILGALELRRQAELGVFNMDSIVALETNSRTHPVASLEDINNLAIKVLAF